MKKNKNNKMFLMALIIIPVILAVCVQPDPNQPTGSPTPDSTFLGTPDVGILEFGRGLPSKIIAGYQLAIEATLKNTAPVIQDRENELSLKNVKVEFYNFGPYIDGCDSDYMQILGKLMPEETQDVMCVINVKATDAWPDRAKTSFEQTLKMKTSFSYDLLASLDDIMVLSKSEFVRQAPIQSPKSAVVSGPVGMTITVDSQPVQEEKTFTVHLELQATKTPTQDIVTTETSPQYNVQYVQLQVPFAVAALGNFDRSEPCAGQTCLIKENVKLNADGAVTLNAQLQAPALASPEETYSVKGLATGFTVFKIADLKITGYAS